MLNWSGVAQNGPHLTSQPLEPLSSSGSHECAGTSSPVFSLISLQSNIAGSSIQKLDSQVAAGGASASEPASGQVPSVAQSVLPSGWSGMLPSTSSPLSHLSTSEQLSGGLVQPLLATARQANPIVASRITADEMPVMIGWGFPVLTSSRSKILSLNAMTLCLSSLLATAMSPLATRVENT